VTGALDGPRQGALVLRAAAALAARLYARAIADEPTQESHVLVVHAGHLFHAHGAGPAPPEAAAGLAVAVQEFWEDLSAFRVTTAAFAARARIARESQGLVP